MKKNLSSSLSNSQFHIYIYFFFGLIYNFRQEFSFSGRIISCGVFFFFDEFLCSCFCLILHRRIGDSPVFLLLYFNQERFGCVQIVYVCV